MDKRTNNWKVVKNNLIVENKNKEQEEVIMKHNEEMKLGNWSKVREEYIGKNKVIVNDIGDHDDKVNSGVREGAKPRSKMSFFNVVKEATEKEKKKKERPSLLKFLEKFDSVDIPECVTPNPSHSFRLVTDIYLII